ncbi:hypothetical protein COBT_004197, partial [Conglomerata obtusa]
RDCPIDWRQYNIIERQEIKEIKKSCCLCFKNDHFLDDCGRGRTKTSIFNSDFMSM